MCIPGSAAKSQSWLQIFVCPVTVVAVTLPLKWAICVPNFAGALQKLRRITPILADVHFVAVPLQVAYR